MFRKRDTSKLEIKIDASDWYEETIQEENFITSEGDIITEIEKGTSTAQIAKNTIVSREVGFADSEIIRPNKALLLSSAMADVSDKAKRQYLKTRTPSGKEIKMPRYIGRIPEKRQEQNDQEQSDEPSYVRSDTDEAIVRAKRYLLNIVPEHIWNHLVIYSAGGGNARDLAEELKTKIDEMVNRLSK